MPIAPRSALDVLHQGPLSRAQHPRSGRNGRRHILSASTARGQRHARSAAGTQARAGYCRRRRSARSLRLAELSAMRADHRDIDEAVGGICRGFDQNHRTRPFCMASSPASSAGGLVDAVGKAHRARYEKPDSVLRQQRFGAAIERLRMQDHVTRPYEGENRGRNRRHPGREQRAGLGRARRRRACSSTISLLGWLNRE